MAQFNDHIINWQFKPFHELTARELYAILRLRVEVFIIEQNCIFQDLDNKDIYCHHLMGWQSEQLVAVTRLVPAGVSYQEPSIGRVATSAAVRRTGTGRLLMQESIRLVETLFGKQPIRIGAQLYLKKFYESFGFVQSGNIYLEDGIEHIEMIRP